MAATVGSAQPCDILQEIKKKTTLANEAATEFVKLFYEAMDSKRHMLDKVYLETGTLLWNGNEIVGRDAIVKYLTALPTTDHKVTTLDSQPLTSTLTLGQTTILVVASGTVRFQGHEKKLFYQNFMLTAENNTWKIARDCIRTVS